MDYKIYYFLKDLSALVIM